MFNVTQILADMRERLEEAFEELEEVGSLVIRRSYYLTSLSFFKSLKRITGEKEYLMSAGWALSKAEVFYFFHERHLIFLCYCCIIKS